MKVLCVESQSTRTPLLAQDNPPYIPLSADLYIACNARSRGSAANVPGPTTAMRAQLSTFTRIYICTGIYLFVLQRLTTACEKGTEERLRKTLQRALGADSSRSEIPHTKARKNSSDPGARGISEPLHANRHPLDQCKTGLPSMSNRETLLCHGGRVSRTRVVGAPSAGVTVHQRTVSIYKIRSRAEGRAEGVRLMSSVTSYGAVGGRSATKQSARLGPSVTKASHASRVCAASTAGCRDCCN
ncbi:hypothetical protein C8R45DRAFT_86516 [Mycena sanguinolenta]|nr:hypothetical protein C8R45DRAFT_86516 [Mycena sanguinolenta]